MLIDFEIDEQKWIKENIIVESWNKVRIERKNNGIQFYIDLEDGDEEMLFHSCGKEDDFPIGIYWADINFSNVLDDIFGKNIDANWMGHQIDDVWYSPYGLCDNYHQVLEHYKDSKFISSNEKWCLLLSPIFRKDQAEHGGFRYHKWGEYIGNQNPTHVYLYDDKHIDMVISYHFYKMG